jgi:hypothetical protein
VEEELRVYFPAAQLEHSEAAEFEYIPEGHRLQDMEPANVETVPAVQLVQAGASTVEYMPTAQ